MRDVSSGHQVDPVMSSQHEEMEIQHAECKDVTIDNKSTSSILANQANGQTQLEEHNLNSPQSSNATLNYSTTVDAAVQEETQEGMEVNDPLNLSTQITNENAEATTTCEIPIIKEDTLDLEKDSPIYKIDMDSSATIKGLLTSAFNNDSEENTSNALNEKHNSCHINSKDNETDRTNDLNVEDESEDDGSDSDMSESTVSSVESQNKSELGSVKNPKTKRKRKSKKSKRACKRERKARKLAEDKKQANSNIDSKMVQKKTEKEQSSCGLQDKIDKTVNSMSNVTSTAGNQEFVFGNGKNTVENNSSVSAAVTSPSYIFQIGQTATNSNSHDTDANGKNEKMTCSKSDSDVSKKDNIVNNVTAVANGTGRENINAGHEMTGQDDKNSRKLNDGTDVDSGVKTRQKTKDEKRMKDEKEKKENLNKNTSNRGQNIQMDTNERTILVMFHALISEEFKFDPDHHKVVLVFGAEDMGGWFKQDRNASVVRQVNGNICEVQYEECIPTRLIYRASGINYKYIIRKAENDNKPEKKYKDHWEHYVKDNKRYKDANRILVINSSTFKTAPDIWHQFDGFVEKEPTITDWFLDLLNWKKNIPKRAKEAVDILLSSFDIGNKFGFSGKDTLEKLKMLWECFHRIYFLDANCWSMNTENYKKFMKTCILSSMVQKLEVDHKSATETGQKGDKGTETGQKGDRGTATNIAGTETAEKRERRISVAITILQVMKEFDIHVSEVDTLKLVHVICQSLLISADKETKQCPELEVADRFFQKNRKELQTLILHIVKKIASCTKDPVWLLLMPWVHLLGDCVPFEEPAIQAVHDDQVPVWWGVAEINTELQLFKRKSGNWTKPVEDVLKSLQPLFEMDCLLPRTFIAAVNLKDLNSVLCMKCIPIEVCLAHLIYYIKTTKQELTWGYIQRNWYVPEVTSVEEEVFKCMSCVLHTLQETADRSDFNFIQWKKTCKIASQLVTECLKTVRSPMVSLSAQMLIHCFAIYETCSSVINDVNIKTDVKEFLHFLTDAGRYTIVWMNKYSKDWRYYMADCLQLWNDLLPERNPQYQNIHGPWNNIILNGLLSTIQEKVCQDSNVMTQFVELYCKKLDTYNPVMQETLSKAAFLAISKGYNVNYGNFTETENLRFGRLLSDLFVSEWKKHISQDNKELEWAILQHVLTWAPFAQYLTIYYKDHHKIKLLTDGCVRRLVQAVSMIEVRVQALLSGCITVHDFNLIQSNNSRFPELVGLLQLKQEYTKDFIKKAIDVRSKEIYAFLEQSEQMTTFTSLCKHLANVDRECVDRVHNKAKNQDQHELREFFKPAIVEYVQDIATCQPYLIAFNVSKEILSMLPELHRSQQSTTFVRLWTSECQKIGDKRMTLDDVVQQVWLPSKKKWMSFIEDMKTGSVKFHKFEQILGKQFGENYDQLSTEMKNLGMSDDLIKQRTDQVKKYRQMETCVLGAKKILKFQKEFKLEGDFDQIQLIARHGENDMEMKSFNDSLMKVCDVLTDFTIKKAACLNMFLECQPLIKWLRESMHQSKLKELKVFVDLAFMSAGDEPMNIGRVQCLHSAVTGYAPLIFDLPTNAGYKEFLDACSLVWKELEANPKLPEQLKGTNEKLEWLKEVKKAHGSVEVTSLMQAEAINANGIYTVGTNAWMADAATVFHNHMTVMDSITLTVPEQELQGSQQQRQYTYTQLQDLQSRLMLVAGKAEKGNDNVNRFTMIFDGVIRLSSVLVKLCSFGCVLFKDWTARLMCDPEPKRPVCVYLQFGQGKDIPKLKCKKSQTEELKDIIPALANFMEDCLVDWLRHIKEKRKTYYHLNYFTVDQLVILQRELVKIGTETGPSHLIFPLLSAVKRNCTPADLIQAMADAKTSINDSEDMEESKAGGTENTAAEVIVEQSEDAKIDAFVDALVDAGFEKRLAVLAAKHVPVDQDNINEGIVWCMEHPDEKMSSEADAHVVNETPNQGEDDPPMPTFSGWSDSVMSIQSLITSNIGGLNQESDVSLLINDLKILWKQFLESISSNIQDYLSLEHLGLILRCLALKETTEINRTLPPGLFEGQPNLIVCPSGDVLGTTLSIYFMDTSKNQPLPSSEEVLMCSSTTTKDEVDIFWRRAIYDDGRKIHCLVHADLLDFDVSDFAAQCLEEHLLDVNYEGLKYRLVIICGSDNEFRSTVVSSLDKYKRQAVLLKLDSLKEYLHSKLVAIPNLARKIRPAAEVDVESLTVRVIKSWRAGVGKTLYKKRKEQALPALNRQTTDSISIPLQEKKIDVNYVTRRLLEHTTRPGQLAARLFHIDISHEAQNGVDYLLFNLLILGCLMESTGYVWRKSPLDLYLIETMPLMIQSVNRRDTELYYVHHMLQILPDLTCRSPQESLEIYYGRRPADYKQSDQLFDEQQFSSPVFQRPFQYLLRLDRRRGLSDVRPHVPEETVEVCLQTLLRHCGVQDPSWAELHNFVWFLNTQLVDFEQNNFVSAAAAVDLPGFDKFVLRFLIQMSRDFSTRSLNISEESPGVIRNTGYWIEVDNAEGNEKDNDELQVYQMRRTWESSPHPYLFFNCDRFTFTFLGFFIERATGNLIDQQTNTVLEQAIMAQNLYDALVRNHAPMQENFDALPRMLQIQKLCNVMGIEDIHDPDDTYELTTDNVKKIMAIYMRFRCDIPVIIMGETGCGKTRLVKFMCALQSPPGCQVQNMILMKVHGGTTNKDIITKIQEAEKIAQENIRQFKHMYTVLFFDEANTTESIGLIKEIMCDKTMEGEKLKLCENLKMVAACNPYRKHSEELIKKLEQAGLGYHVDAEETTDRLGRVPMRRLVYRVQPLPRSLLPLVWDFGQLNIQVEDLYIRQMVRRYIQNGRLPKIPGLIEVVSAVLTASQEYMRRQKDECSFVSLRDVDRALHVMSWFYEHCNGDKTLFKLMDGDRKDMSKEHNKYEEVIEEIDFEAHRSNANYDITRSLILSLGVCFHACLKTREEYRKYIAPYFHQPCQLQNGAKQIADEIERCQDVILSNVTLEKNIAKNMALKENLFMMVVCIELRIPLFLVGKPGSSKSLAKTIVSDAMQGNASRYQLFKELKQAQMVSFQCSPLSTPDGIVGTFKQCAQFQKDKDLNTFVSTVVLDEVGLAEDSPRMPLKTLHPLLEDGCQGDEKPEQYMKVAFIGISNWALDPAKMNRGILVQREVPDLEELISSASGICETTDQLVELMGPLIKPMAESYLAIFEKASRKMREFFGLRDFYSLVKMVYSFVEKSKQKPTWHKMLHAIKRNFGGLDQVDPVKYFQDKLSSVIYVDELPRPDDPDCSASGLIQACLFDTNEMKSESRYLLLLTENYGALTIIQQLLLTNGSKIRPITLFGSSFRSDQEYTQVCRNINKIKVCMETGNTVVLLNLENLYESLYDALNQYYVYFGGERYVDLGLGTHRVKCPVHANFRLIVVAEKQTVYKKFPIPLINRLEKHFLTINTMLSPEQQIFVNQLRKWIKQFAKSTNMSISRSDPKSTSTSVGDVFIGFHDDTCSAVVLHVWQTNVEHTENREKQLLLAAKEILLWCATPESVTLLKRSQLPIEEQEYFQNIYINKQVHGSLFEYLHFKIVKDHCQLLFAQVTTHSKLLASVHRSDLAQVTGIAIDRILLLETLSSFDTEQQFSNKIQHHLQSAGISPTLMVIQCDSGDLNANLIACARYCVMDEYEKLREELKAPVYVVFVVQLPRIPGGCFTGFQCGIWHSVHIDDLYAPDENMPKIEDMLDKSVAKLFGDAVDMKLDEDIQDKPQMEQMEWNYHEAEGSGQIEKPSQQFGTLHQNIDFALFDVEGGSHHISADLVIDTVGQRKVEYSTEYHKINVNGLILSCVQASLSMVKDKDDNKSRATDRVTLVLKFLHEDDQQGHHSFMSGISKLIAKLLKEKEQKLHGIYMANQWLVDEAAKSDNITKAGTFRRSCVQTLESKVSPIFAGVLAYLDTNQNLDLLQEPADQWKQDLWLTLVNNPDMMHLQLKDLQSPTRQSDLQEVLVTTTGCEGHYFSTRLPFSWMIYDWVHEIMTTNPPNCKHIEENMQLYKIRCWVRLLMETPLGKVLEHIPDDAAISEYIHDFVHTVYNAGTVDEHMLVSQYVSLLTKTMADGLMEGGFLHRLVCVHSAYEILASRFTYFHSMNVVWPECSGKILKLQTEQPDHFMFQEQEFILSTLCLLIENLKPDRNDLNERIMRTKWLNKVHCYRPVIEKVLGLYKEDPNVYSVHSCLSYRKARSLWGRVVVMKLFLEHVCISDDEANVTIKYCMPLWTILTDDVDMRQMRSMGAVEKFLKTCNKTALKEFLGAEQKCNQCEYILEGPPISLPCQHILCDVCFKDMNALKEDSCPVCQKHVGLNWNPERQSVNRKEIDKIKNYQKRCNSFFMDVVSQLCFTDNCPPSEEVVDKLLSYIMCSSKVELRTKDMTIFETGLDPNPVFRSFLLQLLMRTSEQMVKHNLKRYFEAAKNLIKQGKHDQEKQLIELSLLVIQCLEDIFMHEAVRYDEIGEIDNGGKLLQQSLKSVKEPGLSVEKLYALASARTGLCIAGKHIASLVSKFNPRQTVDKKLRNLFEAAQILCEDSKVKWFRIFLVKYMCRCFGVDVYGEICKGNIPFLRWIPMAHVNTSQAEGPDRYIVCGDVYTQLRESITKIVLGEDVNHLIEKLQEHQVACSHVEQLLYLAMHREITCCYVYSPQKRKINKEIFLKLAGFVQGCTVVKNKTALISAIQNQLVPEHLSIVENESIQQQGIKCLVVHFMCALSGLKGDGTLLQPLLALICHPHAYVDTYMPTMPQDDLEDVKEALLAARNDPKYTNENPVFYRCPNGHPYVIGDCGRPYTLGKCKCGADIGGESHKLLDTNKLDTGTDQSVKGHILGRADARSHVQVSERSLTPTYCACVRLILHMALYAGTATNTQAINAMITPHINVEEVDQYLWRHILRDVEDLQRSLGRSVDDILLLMHAIVDNIMRIHQQGDTVANDIVCWSSKKGRSEWEAKFSTKFLQAQLQNMDTVLKTNNQKLAKDERLGANQLLCLLYETEGQTEQDNPEMLQECSCVWRFRTPISIEHLRKEFEAQNAAQQRGKKQHRVLELFLKEEHNLRAIRFIPSILRLQRALIHKYQKKLDKIEASSITVAQLIKEEVAGNETSILLKDFTDAWDLVRDSMMLYGCPTDIGGMTVSKEYCSKTINRETPISMLLPTNKEAGLCSYALLDFLMRKQNDFLDKYLKECARKITSIASVSPKEVTSAHLISYDPQQDILPLVFANCQYSFEIGKGTKIEYDFGSLERQLMDRFLFSKSRIDVGRVLQIEMMVYRTEVTNAETFKKLDNKIPQKVLSNGVKTQIGSEIRLLPDLCQSLDNLDIAISFLKTIGGDPQQCLYDFMSQTLKMVSSLHSAKARLECQFQHCRSLWLLLSLLKSQKMCEQNQHRQAIFESVSSEFHDNLPADLSDAFEIYIKDLSIEKLSPLVDVLHEFILMVVALRENPEVENYTPTTNNKLKEWLSEYIEEMEPPPIDIAILKDFPADILYKHTVHAWIVAQSMLKGKQSGNTGRRYQQ